jgi:uncharacterized protein
VPIPAGDTSFLDDDAALARLVADRTIDAMMVIAAQPAKWLADLPPRMAHSIKLLKLDAAHPLGEKAIEIYLPAVVRASSYGGWLAEDTPTLATMAFLVTSEYAEAAYLERLDTFGRALCRHLPTLRRNGHPKWIEVEPRFEIDAIWPYSAPVRAAFQSCLTAHPSGASAVRSR